MIVQLLDNADDMFYQKVLAYACGGATCLALFALMMLSGDEPGAKKKIPCSKQAYEEIDESESERQPILCHHSINGRNAHGSIVPVS